MSYEDILTKNIKKEYTAFRKEQLSKSTETVFENAGKIHFYKNLYCYAVNSNLKTELRLLPILCKPLKWYRIEISFWRLKICQGTKTVRRYGQRKKREKKEKTRVKKQ